MSHGFGGWPMVSPGERLYMPRAGLEVGATVGNITRVVPPPPVEAFTWVNQGTATASNVANGIYLSAPSAGSLSMRCLVMATPGAPWVCTLGYIPDLETAAQLESGMIVRNAGAGTLIDHANGGSNGYSIQKYNSPTSNSAVYTVTQLPWVGHDGSIPLWVRWVDDGTNRIAYYSRDGVTWRQTHTVGRTDFLTADQVGFFVRVDNGFSAITVISWELKNGTG